MFTIIISATENAIATNATSKAINVGSEANADAPWLSTRTNALLLGNRT